MTTFRYEIPVEKEKKNGCDEQDNEESRTRYLFSDR